MTAQEFEEVLEIVGSYGKFQKSMIILVMLPTSFFIGTSVSLILFQTVVPESYWCDPPGRENTNLTKEEWWNLTVPRSSSGSFTKCSHYHLHIENGYYLGRNSNNIVSCSEEWTHDRESFQETMATAMNWLCDKEIYSTHILSVNAAGNAIGTLLLPILADKYTGRRLMFYISCAIHSFFNIFVLFTPWYYAILFLKFVAALSFQTNFQMPYIIGLELTSPDKRALVSFYSFAAWTLGMCFAALIAWAIPNWWYLVILQIAPSIAFFAYWRFFPESPRWLIARGETSKCCDILMNIAKTNGKAVDKESIAKALSLIDPEEDVPSEDIFKYKRLTFNGLLVTVMTFAVFIVYGCMWLNVKILPENYFLSYFVLSFCELPSNIISYLSVHYLGRRFTIVITSMLSIVFCFVATQVLENAVALLVTACMIKIFITQGIYVIYVVAAEVFPTPIRSSGLGLVVVAGMIGLVFSPYIVGTQDDKVFQYWTMIGLNLVALATSILIPETIGLVLPQTNQEANYIGKHRPLFAWIHHWNKEKYLPQTDTDKDAKESMLNNVKYFK